MENDYSDIKEDSDFYIDNNISENSEKDISNNVKVSEKKIVIIILK